ncbi:hypothetical protein P170DRAFT_373173 [Aspergillus steynii IBT 23096]|uniref:Serine-threonine protein kinase 19 n=1 Tax=Aspergillus steynii IBT 23096 TaxID=1392250 RepID=A0A2I2GN62_9EURO|nr:uncharacterized protein P170DRAFT_373173 [Aspergillus steynii IBT 23096]PLB54289.1 hypothetical protein P170DRAFT_373173 [Aspergillus steynii IBT 23096]
MPLRITSAPVSGVKKRRTAATLKPRASPFASHARRKATAATRSPVGSKSDASLEEGDQELLPDLGLSRYVPETSPVEHVGQAIAHIRDSMFEDLPARAGMNSTRVAEVLNTRRSLPPLASVAHIHTLLDAPTRVEKEIIELVNSGCVRRLVVPGRGNDAAGLGDCLVLSEDWERLVRDCSDLEPYVQEKLLGVLNQPGIKSAVPGTAFTAPEYMALIHAGFLVCSSSLTQGSSGMALLPSLPSMSSSGHPASRSGGDAHSSGMAAPSRLQSHAGAFLLSLPNTGPYLRLLEAGRAHLLSLLKKSSATEVPLGVLRDRWDGAIETEKSFDLAKRVRGEYAGILPGRTKKWKNLFGMNFRWVVEEAVGAGLVEIFDTGSVGPGIRCL